MCTTMYDRGHLSTVASLVSLYLVLSQATIVWSNITANDHDNGRVGINLAQLHSQWLSSAASLVNLVASHEHSQLRYFHSSGEHERVARDTSSLASNSIHDRVYHIETIVFVDKKLVDRFSGDEKELKQLVLGILYQTQLIYNYDSLKTRIRIIIKKIVFLDGSKDAPNTANGDIDLYLDNFCAWQKRLLIKTRKKQRWDHALLLTGLDLYKQTGSRRNNKVLGLAWVNGMCKPSYSCTINEGKNFEAAFVIAHEMAHSLGVMHDGNENSCHSDSFIMSDKTGPGKIHWSQCSNLYLDSFLANLGEHNCLTNYASEDSDVKQIDDVQLDDDKLPGQLFDLNKQCQLALGARYKAYLSLNPPFDDVCRELWCADARLAIPAHPALEGSRCGFQQMCYQGKCVPQSMISERKSFAFREKHRPKMIAEHFISNEQEKGETTVKRVNTNSASTLNDNTFMRTIQNFLRTTIRSFQRLFG